MAISRQHNKDEKGSTGKRVVAKLCLHDIFLCYQGCLIFTAVNSTPRNQPQTAPAIAATEVNDKVLKGQFC